MTPYALLLLLAGAPAPAYRPPPPAPVLGSWVMRWGDADCPSTFGPDGSYRSTCHGVAWSGRWSWDARTRTLSVEEAPGAWVRVRWSARLDASLSGALVPVGASPVPVSLRKE